MAPMEDPPLPMVKARLDHRGLPYKPGDKITGVLLLTEDDSQGRKGIRVMGKTIVQSYEEFTVKNVENVTIELRGEALVFSDRGKYPTVLSWVTLVSKSIRIAPNSRGEFAFEIEIPRKTDIDPSLPLFDPNLSYPASQLKEHTIKFATEREHPLPPSMKSIRGRDAGGRKTICGTIIYSINPLKLKFQGLQTEPVASASISAPFWLLQNSPAQADMDALKNDKPHSRAYFMVQDKTLVKKERLSTPDQLPAVTVKVTVSGSSFVFAGEEGQYSFDITPEIERTNITGLAASEFPLYLTKLSAKLVRLWASRNTSSIHQVDRTGVSLKSELVPPGEQPVSFEGRPQGGNYETQQKRVFFKVDKAEVSNFETANIYVSHAVELEATFKCARSMSTASIEIPVKVLPRQRLATAEGETVGFVEGPQDLNEDWGTAANAGSNGEPTIMDGLSFANGTVDVISNTVNIATTAACCTIL